MAAHLTLLVREVAEDGEHGGAAHEADAGVHHGDDEGVAQHGAAELVVAAEGDQGAERDTDRVKHLT